MPSLTCSVYPVTVPLSPAPAALPLQSAAPRAPSSSPAQKALQSPAPRAPTCSPAHKAADTANCRNATRSATQTTPIRPLRPARSLAKSIETPAGVVLIHRTHLAKQHRVRGPEMQLLMAVGLGMLRMWSLLGTSPLASDERVCSQSPRKLWRYELTCCNIPHLAVQCCQGKQQ